MVDLGPLKDALLGRVPNADGVGCVLCKMILQDVARNSRLTGAIFDFHEKPEFSPEGMVKHLLLERLGHLAPPEWFERKK